MKLSKKLLATLNAVAKSDLTQIENLSMLVDLAIHIHDESPEENAEYSLKLTKQVKDRIRDIATDNLSPELNELYWRAILHEAPYIFESYMLYMEKNRPFKKRFYQPRMNPLSVVAQDLQDLEDGKIEFYGLSMPPRVGKSTICIFFLSWIIGKRPDTHNAMGGHSGTLAKGFYKEMLNLTTSADYTFEEIFPDVKIEQKNADALEINYNTPDRFPTLTCRGIDGTWTGAIDISNDGYLYVDDMIRDRTESLSPKRMEDKFQQYLNVLVDRKNDGSRELMVGTRWGIADPLGRIEEIHGDDPEYRFRRIPALNEDMKSNFAYPVNGFSTKHYIKLKKTLDANEWEAKYQQRPFKREGLLFPEAELNTYNGVLPDSGLIRKVAVCDVAWGGGDALSKPFASIYDNGKVYIHDWIYNKGHKNITKPIVVGKMLLHRPHQSHFEANTGGHEYADDIDQQLRKKGFKTSITSKAASNQVSKMARIVQHAPDIKLNFYFLEEGLRDDEYRRAMIDLTTFSHVGKNISDDAPDSLALLSEFQQSNIYAKVTQMERWF